MNETTILLAIKLILQNQNKLAELFLLALQGEKANKNQIHQVLETMKAQNQQVVKGLDSILNCAPTPFRSGTDTQQAQSINDLFNQMLGGPRRQ